MGRHTNLNNRRAKKKKKKKRLYSRGETWDKSRAFDFLLSSILSSFSFSLALEDSSIFTE